MTVRDCVARCGGVLVTLMVLLLAPGSVRPAAAEPERVTMGMYLTAINNLDVAAGTIAADFWIWTVAKGDRRRPLETAYIVNEAAKTAEPIYSKREVGSRWDQQRIRATLNNRFDVASFPFDRQTLQIIVEEGAATTDEIVYVADRERSGVASDASLAGWSILGWTVAAEEHPYATNFGDPGHPGPVTSPRLVMRVDIQRHGWALFLELTVGPFIAFLMMVLTFRMEPTQPAIFSGRMGVTAATVFTTLISLRWNSGTVGAPFGATLVDRIHLLTMAAGFIAALSAVTAWGLAQGGRETLALRLDRALLPIFLIAYIAIVATMVFGALAR